MNHKSLSLPLFLLYSLLTILLSLFGLMVWESKPATAVQPAAPTFLTFESAPVRPLSQTPSGNIVIAVNTPDNAIELFDVQNNGIMSLGSIAVGMEPVAVAIRSETEAWVVNHLSDSISVVDLAQMKVVRTLLVGDEPRDIVFAGANNNRAFITTAHRGQQRTAAALSNVPGAGDPQMTTGSVGRADVWVFDVNDLGDALGGVPLKIVDLFGDTPRALAVTPDRETVYAAVFNSGNQTTVVPMPLICYGGVNQPCDGDDGITSPNGLPNGQMPGGMLPPYTNHEGANAPLVGLIVKYNNENGIWEDERQRNWNNAVRFNLPDYDLFAIDAETLDETNRYAHVGTTLFNMAVNPVNGNVYVTNTESKNEVRFEGAGVYGGSTVQGNLAQAQITVINPTTNDVSPRHLNKHIDYDVRPAPAGTKDHSLATPLEMQVSADGQTLFVAAYGSSKVGIFSTAQLEDDSFDPTIDSDNYIPISGGGAAGLLLDEASNSLFVYTRFDNGISRVDATTGAEIEHVTMHNPELEGVVMGRPILYDAQLTSSNGEASCSSCHIFGDMDHLAWELGDPDGNVTQNELAILFEHDAEANAQEFGLNGTENVRDFHPMKGPMVTQSLRGMQNAGAMHWRGDRSTGFFGDSTSDERLSFKNFIVAFGGLVGDDTLPTDVQRQSDMDDFADFSLALVYPPNPNRALDNSLTPDQQRGKDLFMGPRRMAGAPEWADTAGKQEGATCQECHRLDAMNGFFGTGGDATFEGLTQILKTAHLRNAYTRIGMFGMANTWLTVDGTASHAHTGDQIRGFGFTHEGSYDTIHRFTTSAIFSDTGYDETGFESDEQRRDVEQWLLAFDSDLAPIVGQQVTWSADRSTAVNPRIDLFVERASTPFTSQILGGVVKECELIVQGVTDGVGWGMLFDADSQMFVPDRVGDAAVTLPELRQWLMDNDETATFSCVPYGSGQRMALDRDMDTFLNGDEIVMGSDAADPESVPSDVPTQIGLIHVSIIKPKSWLISALFIFSFPFLVRHFPLTR